MAQRPLKLYGGIERYPLEMQARYNFETDEMRRMRAQGYHIKEIAQRFGISERSVSNRTKRDVRREEHGQ